jgi:hypothetical protein
MRPILAVATLDLRRLWMPVVAAGVALGLFPSLTAGVPLHASAQDTFPFALGIAAVIAGACFGLDFSENRPSFFYARPLPTPALFAGRVAALAALVLLSSGAFLAAQWLSGLVWTADPMARIQPWHARVIATAWAVALFFALAAATHTRQRATIGLGAFILGAVRLIGVLAVTALMVGLFADIVMRAYDRPTPVTILMGSYVIAAFIASCIAIELGRTNRLRIIQILNLAMYVHTTIVVIAVVGTWFYVLRPGPGAITGVIAGQGSPDGGAAYVDARVDRGGPNYRPRFRVDLATGEVRRQDRGGLNAFRDELWQWSSRDGATQVWTDQVPMLLRGARQLFQRSSPLHFQSRFDPEQSLPLPNDLILGFDWELGGPMIEILPSSGGEVFAFYWSNKAGPRLAFVSPARGQLSVVDPAKVFRARAWAFLPSGQLRVAFQPRLERVEEIHFVDIEPATGTVTPVATAPMGQIGESFSVAFDESASRALVEVGPLTERTALLLTLDGSPQPTMRTLAAAKQVNLETRLLADGRIAVVVKQPPTAELRLFSAAGDHLWTVPLGDRGLTKIAGEPFPDVLMVSTSVYGSPMVRLLDTTTGRILRDVEGFRMPDAYFSWNSRPAPSASAGSRLLIKGETLYLLPSMSEAPRPLLPRP